MKFTGGCISKALTVILCILLGFVLSFASIGLAGYIVLTKKGMVGTIADKTSGTVPLNFDDETKAMSILDWGKELFDGVKNMNTGTIGELEKLAGVSVISSTVEKLIGVNADIIKTATLNNLAATISSNLTMQNAKTKFGIEFPDMPIFSDEAFLSSPLSTALSGFNDYKLNQVITIQEDGNAILKKLGTVKISELGGATTDKIVKGTTLGEMMTITDTSSRILKALKYNCIESQYVLNELEEQVYKKVNVPALDSLGHPLLDEFNNPIEIEIELIGINDRINTMIMSEVIEITETSNAILRKMRLPTDEEILEGKAGLFGTEDLLLNDLGGQKLTDIINGTTLGELITINESSEPIMKALKDTSIQNVNSRIATLQLNEIFNPTQLDTGALSLIPPETVLNSIPAAMTNAMLNSTVSTLKNKGILSASAFNNINNMKLAQRAYIYNSNMSDLLGGLINFIADPIDTTNPLLPVANYHFISPTQVDIAVNTFASLTAFVNEYNQYNSLTFVDSVTITIDEVLDAEYYNEVYNCYLIPIFNIITNSTILTFVDNLAQNVDVKFAVFESDKITLARNQCGYFYTDEFSTLMEAIVPTIEHDIFIVP